jgi:hypothetical protein
MAKAPPKRDWAKAQPHRADNGKIASRKFAENNPNKVEWVKGKNDKKK